MPRIGFVFIGYNQATELRYTLHNLRYHSQLADAPVSVVLSGDPDFEDKNATIIEHVPNIVKHSVDDLREHLHGEHKLTRPSIGFNHYREPANQWQNECASCSMLRNYAKGMKNLYEKVGENLDYVVVTESNILILNWGSIEGVAKQLEQSKVAGAFEVVYGYEDENIPWCGADIMPQLFMVDWKFCLKTRFLFEMENTRPDVMEVTMRENLDRCLSLNGKNFDNILNYGNRSQWGVHAKVNFIWFAHLDRPTGSDANSGLRWQSRERQLDYEKRVLQYYGQCLGGCNGK